MAKELETDWVSSRIRVVFEHKLKSRLMELKEQGWDVEYRSVLGGAEYAAQIYMSRETG